MLQKHGSNGEVDLSADHQAAANHQMSSSSALQ